MFTKVMGNALMAGLLALLVPNPGAGQEKDKPKRDDSRNVTMWVSEVAKPGFDNNDWEELGRFPTYEEAVARSTKWSNAHPKSLRLCREREITVRLVPPDPGSKTPVLEENTRPKGGVIVKPNLPTVDPGAMKRSGNKVASLAGKTGTGTIGTSKVSIEFSGKDGKGTFVVSGELTGQGDWQQDGTGVVMETKLSKFRGVLRGDKIVGVRFTKQPGEDGKNALTEWSVTLADKESATKDNPLRGLELSDEVKNLISGKDDGSATKDSPKGPDVAGTKKNKNYKLYSYLRPVGQREEKRVYFDSIEKMKKAIREDTSRFPRSGYVEVEGKGYGIIYQYDYRDGGTVEITSKSQAKYPYEKDWEKGEELLKLIQEKR